MTIEKQENEWIHLDGEALLLKGKIAVNIVPKSIQVLTPSSLSTC
jgi:diacylglycerol kinase family enzyme